MDVGMISSLNSYVKTLKLQTTWKLKQESGDLTGHKKTLDEWLNGAQTPEGGRAGEPSDSSRLQSIQMKVYNGKRLTQKEKEYLKEADPETYEKACSMEREKKAFEAALKRCRTKEEVQRLKLSHLSASLTTVNAVKNNPHITKAQKLEIMLMENGKTQQIRQAVQKFMESGAYQKLEEERAPAPEERPAPGLEPERPEPEADAGGVSPEGTAEGRPAQEAPPVKEAPSAREAWPGPEPSGEGAAPEPAPRRRSFQAQA